MTHAKHKNWENLNFSEWKLLHSIKDLNLDVVEQIFEGCDCSALAEPYEIVSFSHIQEDYEIGNIEYHPFIKFVMTTKLYFSEKNNVGSEVSEHDFSQVPKIMALWLNSSNGEDKNFRSDVFDMPTRLKNVNIFSQMGAYASACFFNDFVKELERVKLKYPSYFDDDSDTDQDEYEKEMSDETGRKSFLDVYGFDLQLLRIANNDMTKLNDARMIPIGDAMRFLGMENALAKVEKYENQKRDFEKRIKDM